MSEPILVAEGIEKGFQSGTQWLQVLRGVNLVLEPGTITGVFGPSGSGKSTLLHILGTLQRPDAGTLRILGREMFRLSDRERSRFRNRHLGFVFQFHHLLHEFSALENVMLPLMLAGVPDARRQAEDWLRDLDLLDRAHESPLKLSGGERQRVAVARALANRPALVLADEPTGNLDRRNAEQLLQIFRRLNQEHGTTFFIVSHNPRLRDLCHRVYLLEDGLLKPGGVRFFLICPASRQLPPPQRANPKPLVLNNFLPSRGRIEVGVLRRSRFSGNQPSSFSVFTRGRNDLRSNSRCPKTRNPRNPAPGVGRPPSCIRLQKLSLYRIVPYNWGGGGVLWNPVGSGGPRGERRPLTGWQDMKNLVTRKARLLARKIVREEVERAGFQVKRILLFGSRARGTAGPKSDWDFYVVIAPAAPARVRWDLADRICERLAEAGIWADVFVQNEATVRQRRNNPGYLTYYVLRVGVEL